VSLGYPQGSFTFRFDFSRALALLEMRQPESRLPRVVKKLKRADYPLKYAVGSIIVSKISAEIGTWHSEDAAELALNYGSAQQFPTNVKNRHCDVSETCPI
jgi:hypothetical protein